MTKEYVRKARKALKDQYGEALAKKATDAFCIHKATNASAVTSSFGAESFTASLAEPLTSGMILEFTDEPVKKHASIIENHSIREKVRDFFSTLQDTEATKINLQEVLRQIRLKAHREKIVKAIHPFNSFIERTIERSFAHGTRSLQQQSYLTKICWLNQSVRTIAETTSLAEIAADPQITKFDVPHKLVREINETGKVLFAPQYRHKFPQTGKGVIVAVIDSEVALNLNALGSRVMHRSNFTKEPWGNPDSHATAIAGIIGSGDDNYMGMAPDVTIYNYKVLATDPSLDSDDFQAALAIQKALEDGVHVANCSWGAGPAGDGTSREARACNSAWELGLTLIKSAGNRGPGIGTLTTPADATGIIVVGATGKDGRKVESYSSRGPLSNGENRPHLVAPGGSAATGIFSCSVGGGFNNFSHGTSFAAPHVTGLLSLILEANPELSPDEQRNYIIKLCSKLEGFGTDDQGEGIISMRSLLQD